MSDRKVSDTEIDKMHEAIDLIMEYAPIKAWTQSLTVKVNGGIIVAVLALFISPQGQDLLNSLDPEGIYAPVVIAVLTCLFNIFQRFKTRTAIGTHGTAESFTTTQMVLAGQVKSAINDLEQLTE